jgi:hypothetical protein
MDALARDFHDTHDMKVKDEIYRLCRELIKLDEPWVCVACMPSLCLFCERQ